MADIIVEVKNCIKSFGDVVAVSDASLSIEKGKIIGFLGPNGAGKTTIIKMILGLTKPQSGTVTLFGKDPFINTSVTSLIGYIGEEQNFPKYMKAREFLVSLAKFHMDGTDAHIRANEVLVEVGLMEVAEKKIRQFSKGMKQRLKIAQSLMHKPALVIADEPFNGLDPVVRRSMFDLFESYRKKYNTTFFISSHILFEMEKIAEKIILLYKGRTIAQGSPYRIREMIDDQPHSIMIMTEKMNDLAKLLIDINDSQVISSINFQKDPRTKLQQMVILTNKPRMFYDHFTEIVTSQEIEVQEIKATDEGLESLFVSLTVG